MKYAYFDLSGTILKHNQPEPIALMPDLLKAMRLQDWDLSILSDYPEAACKSLLAAAGISNAPRVLSSSSSPKGEVLQQDMRTRGIESSVLVDDKPANLESVPRSERHRVRRIGFVGSRKYSPELSTWCARNGVELALSPVDLLEGLQVHVPLPPLDDFSRPGSPDDLLSLIPGLDHPASALAGETAWFDHRYPLAAILRDPSFAQYEKLWLNLGWITCNECLWKTLVESVLRSENISPADVLGNVYKHHEYTAALKSLVGRRKAPGLKHAFHRAINWMMRGIREIGLDAETCRTAHRPMDRHRIDLIRQRMDVCFA